MSKNATGVDQNREDEDGRISQAQSDVQPKDTMSLTEAQEYAKALQLWAREYWGVETERVWRCPLSDGSHVYQTDYYSDGGYCPDDGRKLKLITVECQKQKYWRNLEDFIRFPEYPEPPQEVTT